MQEEEVRNPNHLGDIMSLTETNEFIRGDFTPLERIVLTANGNLQRIMSAYHNSAVTVRVIHNNKVPTPTTNEDSSKQSFQYDRKVEIVCMNEAFCTAMSTITITNPQMMELISSGQVGIGQLFRHLNVLPQFNLLEYGKREGVSLYRLYELDASGINCRILEEFSQSMFA